MCNDWRQQMHAACSSRRERRGGEFDRNKTILECLIQGWGHLSRHEIAWLDSTWERLGCKLPRHLFSFPLSQFVFTVKKEKRKKVSKRGGGKGATCGDVWLVGGKSNNSKLLSHDRLRRSRRLQRQSKGKRSWIERSYWPNRRTQSFHFFPPPPPLDDKGKRANSSAATLF